MVLSENGIVGALQFVASGNIKRGIGRQHRVDAKPCVLRSFVSDQFVRCKYYHSTHSELMCECDGPATSLSRNARRTGVVVCDLDSLAAVRAKVQGAASAIKEVHSDALVILYARLAAGRRILVGGALALPQVLRVESVFVTD